MSHTSVDRPPLSIGKFEDRCLLPFYWLFIEFSAPVEEFAERESLGVILAVPNNANVYGGYASRVARKKVSLHPDELLDNDEILARLVDGDTRIKSASSKCVENSNTSALEETTLSGETEPLPPVVRVECAETQSIGYELNIASEGTEDLEHGPECNRKMEKKGVGERFWHERVARRCDSGLGQQQLRKLADSFGIDRIVGVDAPVSIEDGADEIEDERYVGLRWEAERPSEDQDRVLPIYERFSVVFGELGTFNVFPVVVDRRTERTKFRKPEDAHDEDINELLGDRPIRLSKTQFDAGDYVSGVRGWKGGRNLNFDGGLFEGRIYVGDADTCLPVLVHPHKVDPVQSERILHEVLQRGGDEGTGVTAVGLDVGDAIEKNPLRALFQLVKLMDDDPHGDVSLRQSLRFIRQQPDKELRTQTVTRKSHEVRNPSPDALRRAVAQGDVRPISDHEEEHFENPGDPDSHFRLTEVGDREAEVTYNTYPNQFVRFFLELVRRIVQRGLSAISEKEGVEREGRWSRQLEQSAREILVRDVEPLMREDWMEEVSELRELAPPPRKLVQDANYGEVFLNYRDLVQKFVHAPKLEEYLLAPVEYMPELYERWCELKLRDAASDLKGVANVVVEPSFRGSVSGWQSYTVGLTPDFGLLCNDEGSSDVRDLILLDAKYRVEKEAVDNVKGDEGAEIRRERNERRGTWKHGDLYKMHTYREAIRRDQDGGDGCPESPKWVLILYPGDEAIFYPVDAKASKEDHHVKFTVSPGDSAHRVRRRLRGFCDTGGVGAIPLSPDVENGDSRNWLSLLLEQLIDTE